MFSSVQENDIYKQTIAHFNPPKLRAKVQKKNDIHNRGIHIFAENRSIRLKKPLEWKCLYIRMSTTTICMLVMPL